MVDLNCKADLWGEGLGVVSLAEGGALHCISIRGSETFIVNPSYLKQPDSSGVTHLGFWLSACSWALLRACFVSSLEVGKQYLLRQVGAHWPRPKKGAVDEDR